MDPIQEAIEGIESREESADFSYREVAKRFGVSRATLARRHKGITQSNAGGAQQRQKLSPQQEQELIRYIERLKKRGLHPTREMVRNFAGSIAQEACSDRWVSRFLERNHASLTTKYTTGIDRNRHQADSEVKYSL
jgi:transposase